MYVRWNTWKTFLQFTVNRLGLLHAGRSADDWSRDAGACWCVVLACHIALVYSQCQLLYRLLTPPAHATFVRFFHHYCRIDGLKTSIPADRRRCLRRSEATREVMFWGQAISVSCIALKIMNGFCEILRMGWGWPEEEPVRFWRRSAFFCWFSIVFTRHSCIGRYCWGAY